MQGRSFAVRRAGTADAPLLAALVAGEDAAAAGPAGLDVPQQRLPLAAVAAGARAEALLVRADVEVHVAVALDAPGVERAVGLAVLRRSEVLVPVPAPLLHVEQLWVDPAWRRRGVGHQLLAAVAAAAEAAGVEEVSAAARPGQREAQRFLARLGFARPVVVRAAPVGVLRARLAASGAAPAAGRRRAALEQLVARRRRQLGVSGAARPSAGT